MLDTVRNPMLHRDRMTSLQSKSAAKDSDARKVLGDKYDAMDKAKNETYRELGTAMYQGGHHRPRLGSGRDNDNVGDANFLPAWMLLVSSLPPCVFSASSASILRMSSDSSASPPAPPGSSPSAHRTPSLHMLLVIFNMFIFESEY